MAEILDHFGPESRQPQAPRAESGGCCDAKELPYSPPVGPTPHMRQGPGLGGTNHGSSGTQGRR